MAGSTIMLKRVEAEEGRRQTIETGVGTEYSQWLRPTRVHVPFQITQPQSLCPSYGFWLPTHTIMQDTVSPPSFGSLLLPCPSSP